MKYVKPILVSLFFTVFIPGFLLLTPTNLIFPALLVMAIGLVIFSLQTNTKQDTKTVTLEPITVVLSPDLAEKAPEILKQLDGELKKDGFMPVSPKEPSNDSR